MHGKSFLGELRNVKYIVDYIDVRLNRLPCNEILERFLAPSSCIHLPSYVPFQHILRCNHS